MKTSPLFISTSALFPSAVRYLSWRVLNCLIALCRAHYTPFSEAHLVLSWPNLHATWQIQRHNRHAQWHIQCSLPNNCQASVCIHDLCLAGADAVPELPTAAPALLSWAVLAGRCGYWWLVFSLRVTLHVWLRNFMGHLFKVLNTLRSFCNSLWHFIFITLNNFVPSVSLAPAFTSLSWEIWKYTEQI